MLNDLFNPEVRKILHKEKVLFEGLQEYIYLLYEKVNKIMEIRNKYFDISVNNISYVKDDYEKYRLKDTFPAGNKNLDKDRRVPYYKKWINVRLKRILKIMTLNSKVLSAETSSFDSVITLLNILIEKFDSNPHPKMIAFVYDAKKLRSILDNQKNYFTGIYPIKTWSEEIHKTLFSETFLNLLKEEVSLVTGLTAPDNVNELSGFLSKHIHLLDIPSDVIFKQLLDKEISSVKKMQKNRPKEFITGYHARPITDIHKKLFPLDTKYKAYGFFFDLDEDETVSIVSTRYDLKPSDLEIIEISLPARLFRKSVADGNGQILFHDSASYDHAYVVKPTHFPLFNEYVLKGLIKWKSLGSALKSQSLLKFGNN